MYTWKTLEIDLLKWSHRSNENCGQFFISFKPLSKKERFLIWTWVTSGTFINVLEPGFLNHHPRNLALVLSPKLAILYVLECAFRCRPSRKVHFWGRILMRIWWNVLKNLVRFCNYHNGYVHLPHFSFKYFSNLIASSTFSVFQAFQAGSSFRRRLCVIKRGKLTLAADRHYARLSIQLHTSWLPLAYA